MRLHVRYKTRALFCHRGASLRSLYRRQAIRSWKARRSTHHMLMVAYWYKSKAHPRHNVQPQTQRSSADFIFFSGACRLLAELGFDVTQPPCLTWYPGHCKSFVHPSGFVGQMRNHVKSYRKGSFVVPLGPRLLATCLQRLKAFPYPSVGSRGSPCSVQESYHYGSYRLCSLYITGPSRTSSRAMGCVPRGATTVRCKQFMHIAPASAGYVKVRIV